MPISEYCIYLKDHSKNSFLVNLFHFYHTFLIAPFYPCLAMDMFDTDKLESTVCSFACSSSV